MRGRGSKTLVGSRRGSSDLPVLFQFLPSKVSTQVVRSPPDTTTLSPFTLFNPFLQSQSCVEMLSLLRMASLSNTYTFYTVHKVSLPSEGDCSLSSATTFQNLRFLHLLKSTSCNEQTVVYYV